ncbi:hypothetical protein PAMC26510_11130 [Caballeronia sordidicola]|uniref:Uncharacterized protein n=1 Tax=Caballeronia sordidicola TaxID=196367 RepID=A0A242N1R2_CABSO|nr:hypothetical protein PAMC26510_11130 [Caballeronia sordidicola]OTP77620.1 hypothetical protein PAMC26577_08285 [Caballeronia sordidicola]
MLSAVHRYRPRRFREAVPGGRPDLMARASSGVQTVLRREGFQSSAWIS